MAIYAYSRQPIGTEDNMSVFLDIAKEQYEYYQENVFYLIAKGDTIMEFCLTPIINNMNVSKKEKEKLQEIVDTVNQIKQQLVNIKEKIDGINI